MKEEKNKSAEISVDKNEQKTIMVSSRDLEEDEIDLLQLLLPLLKYKMQLLVFIGIALVIGFGLPTIMTQHAQKTQITQTAQKPVKKLSNEELKKEHLRLLQEYLKIKTAQKPVKKLSNEELKSERLQLVQKYVRQLDFLKGDEVYVIRSSAFEYGSDFEKREKPASELKLKVDVPALLRNPNHLNGLIIELQSIPKSDLEKEIRSSFEEIFKTDERIFETEAAKLKTLQEVHASEIRESRDREKATDSSILPATNPNVFHPTVKKLDEELSGYRKAKAKYIEKLKIIEWTVAIQSALTNDNRKTIKIPWNVWRDLTKLTGMDKKMIPQVDRIIKELDETKLTKLDKKPSFQVDRIIKELDETNHMFLSSMFSDKVVLDLKTEKEILAFRKFLTENGIDIPHSTPTKSKNSPSAKTSKAPEPKKEFYQKKSFPIVAIFFTIFIGILAVYIRLFFSNMLTGGLSDERKKELKEAWGYWKL